MKTIEERAKYLEQKVIEYNPTTSSEHLYTLAYNALNEQRKIDIDKACEWLKNNMLYGYDVEHGVEYPSVSLEEFRKAMKGE